MNTILSKIIKKTNLINIPKKYSKKEDEYIMFYIENQLIDTEKVNAYLSNIAYPLDPTSSYSELFEDNKIIQSKKELADFLVNIGFDTANVNYYLDNTELYYEAKSIAYLIINKTELISMIKKGGYEIE